MVFDTARNRIVTVGGTDLHNVLGDTWERANTDWVQRTVSPGPGPHGDHAMVFDSARGRTVLYGGFQSFGSRAGDTWEYYAACDVAGPGHPGGGLVLACAVARLGLPFCTSFSDPSPFATGFGHLLLAVGAPLSPPLPLAPPGVCAGGSLYLVPQVAFQLVGNPAVMCLPVPPVPALAGTPVTLQGAAFEQPGCFRLTDGMVVVLQP
jgi:hypothetical protein